MLTGYVAFDRDNEPYTGGSLVWYETGKVTEIYEGALNTQLKFNSLYAIVS